MRGLGWNISFGGDGGGEWNRGAFRILRSGDLTRDLDYPRISSSASVASSRPPSQGFIRGMLAILCASCLRLGSGSVGERESTHQK